MSVKLSDIKEGDTIRFNYGIPPVSVNAEVIERDGILIMLTPGHSPEECTVEYAIKLVPDLELVKGEV